MQQMPDFGQIDLKDEIPRLKGKINTSRRKVCGNYQTKRYKLDIVVYRFQNNIYLKNLEMELKLTE